MGRSIDEGDQHVTNKSLYGRIAGLVEKRGGICRFENDSIRVGDYSAGLWFL